MAAGLSFSRARGVAVDDDVDLLAVLLLIGVHVRQELGMRCSASATFGAHL